MKERFETTRWSLVLGAAADDALAREALEGLCRAYWYPIYAFVRRQGKDPDQASDLTQAYFTYFLESGYVDRADPAKGKFRSFLLVSVKHFLLNENTRQAALKRRADDPAFRLPLDRAEHRFQADPAADGDPEAVFERRWATTLMARAFDRLEADYVARDQADLYRRLRGLLTDDDAAKPYSKLAVELGMTVSAVKVAIHRMRKRLGSLLRDEVAQTVPGETDVDGELRHLLAVVAGHRTGCG